MADKPPFTSSQLDAAIRKEMYRHLPTLLEEMADKTCDVCRDFWPCQYVVEASITLKLSALVAVLQGDAQTISLIGGLNANSQKGQG